MGFDNNEDEIQLEKPKDDGPRSLSLGADVDAHKKKVTSLGGRSIIEYGHSKLRTGFQDLPGQRSCRPARNQRIESAILARAIQVKR